MPLHDELLTTLVMYIGRLAAAGQLPLLRQIGMSPQQIERVRRLSLAEMNELSTLGGHFMDIRVDAESFERALAVTGRRLGEKTVAERLLRAGACHPAMKALTGMETREFVARRQMLGLAGTGNGRTAKPDAEGQHRICKAWVDCSGEADPKLRLLEVHAATGFPVRAIWPVVNAWEGRGELPIADGDHGRWLDLLQHAQAKSIQQTHRAGHSAASAHSVHPPPSPGSGFPLLPPSTVENEFAMSTPTTPTVQVKKTARPAPVPQPGALRNQARLEIQTRQAQFLLDGRTGPRGIIGLLQFARRLGDICQAAQQGDPHADWMLLRVEESIDAAKAFIQEKNIATGKALNELGAMKIELARTREPAMVDLVFGTPYGFMGAYLLSDYDELARTVLTAHHCAVIDRQRAGELIRACGNAVRRVYQLPAAWRRTDVTRDDVRRGTDAGTSGRSGAGCPGSSARNGPGSCRPVLRCGRQRRVGLPATRRVKRLIRKPVNLTTLVIPALRLIR